MWLHYPEIWASFHLDGPNVWLQYKALHRLTEGIILAAESWGVTYDLVPQVAIIVWWDLYLVLCLEKKEIRKKEMTSDV